MNRNANIFASSQHQTAVTSSVYEARDTGSVMSASSSMSQISGFSDLSGYSNPTKSSALSVLSGLTGSSCQTYLYENDEMTRWRELEGLVEEMPQYPVRRSSVLGHSSSMRVLSPRRKAPSKPQRRQSLVCVESSPKMAPTQLFNKSEPFHLELASSSSDFSSEFEIDSFLSEEKGSAIVTVQRKELNTSQTGQRWTYSDPILMSQDLPVRPVRRSSVAPAPCNSQTQNGEPGARCPAARTHDKDRWCDILKEPLLTGPSRPSRRSSIVGSDLPVQQKSRTEAEQKAPSRATSCSELGLDEFVPQETLRPELPSKNNSSGGLAPVLTAMQKSLEPATDSCPDLIPMKPLRANDNTLESNAGGPAQLSRPFMTPTFSASTAVSKLSTDSASSSAKYSMFSADGSGPNAVFKQKWASTA